MDENWLLKTRLQTQFEFIREKCGDCFIDNLHISLFIDNLHISPIKTRFAFHKTKLVRRENISVERKSIEPVMCPVEWKSIKPVIRAVASTECAGSNGLSPPNIYQQQSNHKLSVVPVKRPRLDRIPESSAPYNYRQSIPVRVSATITTDGGYLTLTTVAQPNEQSHPSPYDRTISRKLVIFEQYKQKI